jgi:hypothetical protein
MQLCLLTRRSAFSREASRAKLDATREDLFLLIASDISRRPCASTGSVLITHGQARQRPHVSTASTASTAQKQLSNSSVQSIIHEWNVHTEKRATSLLPHVELAHGEASLPAAARRSSPRPSRVPQICFWPSDYFGTARSGSPPRRCRECNCANARVCSDGGCTCSHSVHVCAWKASGVPQPYACATPPFTRDPILSCAFAAHANSALCFMRTSCCHAHTATFHPLLCISARVIVHARVES